MSVCLRTAAGAATASAAPDQASLCPDINGMDPDVVVSTRPFRNITNLSKAARTHRLRKLRTPSKCRECDSYVYFQGAECEEVRPRPLCVPFVPPPPGPLQANTLSPARLPAVFPGVSQALPGVSGHPVRPQEAAGPPAALRPRVHPGGGRRQRRRPLHPHQVRLRDRETGHEDEGGPEVVCLRLSDGMRCSSVTLPCLAAAIQGIYRVNGVKTRVEKLCQAFENGKELVELSQCSPHDISNVLKLYLRQVLEAPIGNVCLFLNFPLYPLCLVQCC